MMRTVAVLSLFKKALLLNRSEDGTTFRQFLNTTAASTGSYVFKIIAIC